MIINKDFIPILKQCSLKLCKLNHKKEKLKAELSYESKLLPKIIFSGIQGRVAPYEQRQAKSLIIANQRLLFGLNHTPNSIVEKRNLGVGLNYYHAVSSCLNNGYSPERCAQTMTHILRYLYFDTQGVTKHHIYHKCSKTDAENKFYSYVHSDKCNQHYIILHVLTTSYKHKQGKYYTQTFSSSIMKGEQAPQYCIVTYADKNLIKSFPVIKYSPTVTLTHDVFNDVEASFRHLLIIFLQYGVRQSQYKHTMAETGDAIIQNIYYIHKHNLYNGSSEYLGRLIALSTTFKSFLSKHSKYPAIIGPFHVTNNLEQLVADGDVLLRRLFIKKYHGSKHEAEQKILKIEINNK